MVFNETHTGKKILRVGKMSDIIFEDGCRTKPQREEAPAYWENRRRLKPYKVKCPSSPLHFLNNLVVSNVPTFVTIN